MPPRLESTKLNEPIINSAPPVPPSVHSRIEAKVACVHQIRIREWDKYGAVRGTDGGLEPRQELVAAFRCAPFGESESEPGNGGSISCTGLVYQSVYAYLQVVEGLTATCDPATGPCSSPVLHFLPADSCPLAGLEGMVCSARRREDRFHHDGFGSLRRGSRAHC